MLAYKRAHDWLSSLWDGGVYAIELLFPSNFNHVMEVARVREWDH